MKTEGYDSNHAMVHRSRSFALHVQAIQDHERIGIEREVPPCDVVTKSSRRKEKRCIDRNAFPRPCTFDGWIVHLPVPKENQENTNESTRRRTRRETSAMSDLFHSISSTFLFFLSFLSLEPLGLPPPFFLGAVSFEPFGLPLLPLAYGSEETVPTFLSFLLLSVAIFAPSSTMLSGYAFMIPLARVRVFFYFPSGKDSERYRSDP